MLKGDLQVGSSDTIIKHLIFISFIGQEKGHFLALDLGGTNLRVVLVTLEGQGKYSTKYSKSRVTEDLKTGPMRALCGKSLSACVCLFNSPTCY